MNKTPIEWTDYTWNPIRARLKGANPESDCDCPCKICATGHCGHPPCDQLRTIGGTFCTRISPGCTHCYASTINKRFGNGLEYTVPNLEKVEFFIDEKIMAEPMHRKKPARIFVGDMFDLFHEAIPDDLIGEVFAVMEQCRQHTFQVLTKRAERMRKILTEAADTAPQRYRGLLPLPNIWLGVSVEDQQRADERIPLLLKTPSAVRFLSVEPQLEPICLTRIPWDENLYRDALYGSQGIHWVICGGESGPGARPFNLAWAESLLEQCRAAGVAFFMKQLGSDPRGWPAERIATSWPRLRDRKGGDPSEWPEALRVREFPASQKAEVVSA
jgi:protein gp37